MANLRTGLALLATLSLLPAAAAVAQQQSQSSSQQKDKDKEKDKPKPKAKKVWSEDDVKELRKPWDQVEEAKKEEGKPGEAAAGQAAEGQKAAGEGTGAPENDDPKTLEEANQRMDAKYQEVRGQQQLLAELQRELYDTSSDQSREELRAKIENARTKLLAAQMEFKKLNEVRDQLKAKQDAGETKPPAEAPPVKPPSL